jgi:hypothetical protein
LFFLQHAYFQKYLGMWYVFGALIITRDLQYTAVNFSHQIHSDLASLSHWRNQPVYMLPLFTWCVQCRKIIQITVPGEHMETNTKKRGSTSLDLFTVFTGNLFHLLCWDDQSNEAWLEIFA